MVQGPTPEAVEAIRHPPSIDIQNASLKQVKNDIVGHDQRKQLLVRQNLVEPLVRIVASPEKAVGKMRLDEVEDERGDIWTKEDDAKLQSILILGSLACGGPAFVPPLLAADVPKHLVDLVQPETHPRLVTAALQALRSLASSWSLQNDALDSRELSTFGIFDERCAAAFASILRDSTEHPSTHRQAKFVAEIISHSATSERELSLLTNHGVLDALVLLLVALSGRNGHFNGHISPHSTLPDLEHAPPPDSIPSILTAITTIISGSNFRALRFVLSQTTQDVFGTTQPDNTLPSTQLQDSGPLGAIEARLPSLHLPNSSSASINGGSRAFPALSSLQTDRGSGLPAERRLHGWYANHAAAVCGWLLVLARGLQGANRLMALRLLALVNNAIEADAESQFHKTDDIRRQRHRERQIGLLAVPLAVQLVQVATETKVPESVKEKQEHDIIREQSCEVLALLVRGNKWLQLAAVNAGAIKRICPLLKKSFDSVPVTKPMWTSRSLDTTQDGEEARPASAKLGERGLPPEILHVMRCRHSALEALAALATKEDDHRKAIVEAGVFNSVVESLKPFPPEVFTDLASAKQPMTPSDGNTTAVILAACHAAQSMSRAVAILRTSLIDAGIAMPIFSLLKHADPAVQVAATDVCCNLVTDFSPMREDLLNAGAIKTLTEHARQSGMRLRLASLWALKHLVLNASKEIKLQCLEDLGTGWLVGAIQGDQHDVSVVVPSSGGVSIGLLAPNAAGEKVELLNPTSMDVDDDSAHLHGDGRREEGEDEEDEDGEVMFDEQSSTHYQASQLRSTLFKPPVPFSSKKYLSSMEDLETNPALQAKRSDIAVQEQALDFLRNFIHGDQSAAMLDHLIEQIGSAKIFALLSDKLSPLPLSARPAGTLNTIRPIYQPTELIIAAIHVLTHIANGPSRHKSLLIAQRPLLQAWLPHFSHPDRRVRVISVWVIISLTWVDDDSDRVSARQRAQELRSLGLEAAVRSLENDRELDVRERVRTAVRQLDGL